MSVLRTMGGFVLVLIGVIGLILPVMPGWIFLIPGLGLIGRALRWAKRLVAWAKQKAGISAIR